VTLVVVAAAAAEVVAAAAEVVAVAAAAEVAAAAAAVAAAAEAVVMAAAAEVGAPWPTVSSKNPNMEEDYLGENDFRQLVYNSLAQAIQVSSTFAKCCRARAIVVGSDDFASAIATRDGCGARARGDGKSVCHGGAL
jgi:hypothetical protein